MIPDNIEQIVAKLIMKTQEGKAIWERSERETEYLLKFSKGTVVLDHYKNAFDKVIDLAILNSDGNQVDYFEISKKENERDYNDLKKLYEIIYSKDFKIDETIESILRELDSDGVIGGPVIKKKGELSGNVERNRKSAADTG